MTDAADFLAAVIERPDDDLPRLVYADWLDEHAGVEQCSACTDKTGFCWGKVADCHTCHGVGEIENHFADRAEFIRVQCELARLDGLPCDCAGLYAPEPSGPNCTHRIALERREQELMTPDNCRAWANLPAEFDRDETGRVLPIARFHRGFVSEIGCEWANWCSHASVLLAACPIARAKDGLVRLFDMPPFVADDSGPGVILWNDGTVSVNLQGVGRWHVRESQPGVVDSREIVLRILDAEWRGVRFELPVADWNAGNNPRADLDRALAGFEAEFERNSALQQRIDAGPDMLAESIRRVAGWRRRAGV